MRTIPLTRGKVAVVDDEDYERLAVHRWCAQPRISNEGREVWYAVTFRPKRYMHRDVLGLAPHDPRVDHKDHDGLNNVRSNLRLATQSQNLGHQRKQLRPTSSVYKGVSWNKQHGRWESYIGGAGNPGYVATRVRLGMFESETEAAKAYDTAAAARWGEFAVLNFPEAG